VPRRTTDRAAKPRIVLAVEVFPATAQPYVIERFVRLREAGWDVRVSCAQFDEAAWDGIPVLADHPKWRKRLTVSDPPQRLAAIADLAPQLVHAEFASVAAQLLDVRRAVDCRLILSFQGYEAPLVVPSALTRRLWREADAIHTVSADVWRAVQRAGCPADRVHAVIPPGVDADFFDPGPRRHRDVAGSARPVRILSVGRLHWTKGHDYGLQAVRLLRERGIPCTYRLVGSGELRLAVAYTIVDLQLSETVTLLGACPPARIREELAWADVLLHPSVSEGFGIAPLEAQAMMVPVVCSDANGLPEAVVDGETGLVVPRRDPHALAAALARLARAPEERQRLGQAGRDRVQARFRPDAVAEQFMRLYRQVLDRSPLTQP
jgi:colanic acid/amylovoran biosynthesis glycosyltransferase